MTIPPIAILLFGLFFGLLAGFVVPRRFAKRANPKPHHRADEFYHCIKVSGEDYAFTSEQLGVARARAVKLAIDVR